MQQPRMIRYHRSSVVAAIALLSVLPTQAAELAGGATPDEVFERMRSAAADANYREMASCITPQGRAEIGVMMFLVAGMSSAFTQMGEEMAAEMAEASDSEVPQPPEGEDLNKKLAALLDRHGLDQKTLEAAGPSTGTLPKQLESPEFFVDILSFIDEIPGEEGAAEQFQIPDGDLSGLSIDGEQASARFGEEQIDFVKLDGRWYLQPNLGF